MSALLVAAICAITLALALYTFGVFGERRAGRLAARHLVLFWLGFACDTTGTTAMTLIAHRAAGSVAPLHAVSGGIAIALMLFHAVWASIVLLRDNERARENFHHLSIGVWLFWLVPYTVGVLMGVPAFHLSSTMAAVVGVGMVLVLAVGLCIKANYGRRRDAKHARVE